MKKNKIIFSLIWFGCYMLLAPFGEKKENIKNDFLKHSDLSISKIEKINKSVLPSFLTYFVITFIPLVLVDFVIRKIFNTSIGDVLYWIFCIFYFMVIIISFVKQLGLRKLKGKYRINKLLYEMNDWDLLFAIATSILISISLI